MPSPTYRSPRRRRFSSPAVPGRRGVTSRPVTDRPRWLVLTVTGVLVAGLGVALEAAPSGAGAAGSTATRRLLAADGFGRYLTHGLGHAPRGGTWYVRRSVQVSTRVATGAAQLHGLQRGTRVEAWLPRATATNVQTRISAATPRRRGSSGSAVAAEGRRQSDGRAYRARLTYTGGRPLLSLVRVDGRGRETALRTLRLPFTPRAGQGVDVDLAVAGTHPVRLAARAWLPGHAHSHWQLSVSDSSTARITRAGAVGLTAYRARSSSASAFRFAGFRAWVLLRPERVVAAPSQPVPPPAPGPSDPDPAPPTGTPVPPPSGDQPGPGNTGVPAGTRLTVVDGDLSIKTSGTYSGLDVHGFVHVLAPDVTIRNSIVRGGIATGNIGLVNVVVGYATNFLIEDSELVPAHPSVYIDGITGWNYTARRLDIHGTVDGAKIFGDDATIEDSWIHDLAYYSSDASQGGNPTHNDAVQVLGGTNLRIAGNTLQGGDNSALQVTQTRGIVHLQFAGNYVGGGACTVNLQDAPLSSMSGISVDSNRFARNSTYNCPILAFTGVTVDLNGNTWSDGTAPVPVIRRS